MLTYKAITSRISTSEIQPSNREYGKTRLKTLATYTLKSMKLHSYPSLQIVTVRLSVNLVELWLCREPSGMGSTNCLVCECGILVVDFDSLPASTGSGRISHELCMTAFLETDEPEDCFFHRFADCEQTVVL